MLARLKAVRIAAAVAAAAGLTLLCSATASAATDTPSPSPSSDPAIQISLGPLSLDLDLDPFCQALDDLNLCCLVPGHEDDPDCHTDSPPPDSDSSTSTPPTDPGSPTTTEPTTSEPAPATSSTSKTPSHPPSSTHPSSTPASTSPDPTPASTAPARTNHKSVDSGDSVHVSAGGFTPGERVQIWLHSDPVLLTTVTADQNGNVASDVQIPSDTPAGQHEITMQGMQSNYEAATPLTVYVPVPSGLKQGDTFTVTVGGFQPGETIDAILHSAPILLATRVANASGSATFTLTIPKDAPGGTHHIEFVGRSSHITESTANFVLPQVQVPATDDPNGGIGGAADPAGAGAPVPAGVVQTVSPQVAALASTGVDGGEAVGQAVVGATLVAVGGGLMVLSRRRRLAVAPVSEATVRRSGRRRH